MSFRKKIIVWAIVLGGAYFLLGYHIIFFGKHPILLKKSRLSLNYTFFSVQKKPLKDILAIHDLRVDGIADILVEEGRMTEAQRDLYLQKYDDTGESD